MSCSSQGLRNMKKTDGHLSTSSPLHYIDTCDKHVLIISSGNQVNGLPLEGTTCRNFVLLYFNGSDHGVFVMEMNQHVFLMDHGGNPIMLEVAALQMRSHTDCYCTNGCNNLNEHRQISTAVSPSTNQHCDPPIKWL